MLQQEASAGANALSLLGGLWHMAQPAVKRAMQPSTGLSTRQWWLVSEWNLDYGNAPTPAALRSMIAMFLRLYALGVDVFSIG
jgi:hypothetical protein